MECEEAAKPEDSADRGGNIPIKDESKYALQGLETFIILGLVGRREAIGFDCVSEVV